MKDNYNNHKVIMSRELYDQLMTFAEEGAKHINPSTPLHKLQRIKWHLRKFNVALHQERQLEVAKEEVAFKEAKRRVASLLETAGGKEVWLRVAHTFKHNTFAFHKVTLVCRAFVNKTCVTVRYPNGYKTSAPCELIAMDLPEGYVYHSIGPYHGTATNAPLTRLN